MKGKSLLGLLIVLVFVTAATTAIAEDPIKICRIGGISGALEAYAKQSMEGFKLGLEYATKLVFEWVTRLRSY